MTRACPHRAGVRGGCDLSRRLTPLLGAEAARPLPAHGHRLPAGSPRAPDRCAGPPRPERQWKASLCPADPGRPLRPQPCRPYLRPSELHDEAFVDKCGRRPPQGIRPRVAEVDPERRVGELRSTLGNRRSQRLLGSIVEPADRHDGEVPRREQLASRSSAASPCRPAAESVTCSTRGGNRVPPEAGDALAPGRGRTSEMLCGVAASRIHIRRLREWDEHTRGGTRIVAFSSGRMAAPAHVDHTWGVRKTVVSVLAHQNDSNAHASSDIFTYSRPWRRPG